MAKARNARRKASIGPVEKLDGPTPEQIAKGGYVREDFIHGETAKGVTTFVNHGHEEGGRHFKTRHLDRLHKAGQFTDLQYAAGVWYRDQHDRCRYDQPQVCDLNRVQGGNVTRMSDWKEIARDTWRSARLAIPADMVGFVDAMVLRNRWPKMHHRERFRTLDRVRGALDVLARHIQHGR